MNGINLEELPRETLLKLIRMYSRNWQTLDALWFSNVETECGLQKAIDIDLRNWEKQATIEARRIKEVLELSEGGLSDVLTVLSYMSWQVTSPMFVCESEHPGRAVIKYPHCAVQEGRSKKNKPVFPCRKMKLTLLSSIARVVNPAVTVKCLSCPPDAKQSDYWCKWELILASPRVDIL